MNEIVWDAPSGDIEWDTPKKGRGYGEELLRQGGLTLRHGIEGVAGLPAMVMDPLNKMMGLKPLSQGVSGVLDSVGLPKPESDTEKFIGAVGRGVAGASPVTAAAMAAKGSLAGIPMLRSIAANPMTDLASSGVGAGAANIVEQNGGGAIPQAIAGAVAPMGLGVLASGARAAGGVANEVRRPLTQKGAEQIAADTLGRLATDKRAAVFNLQHFNTVPGGVPGSRPMSAQAAGDYGLAGAQQAISRGDNAADVAVRQAQNNAARLDDLSRLNATQAQIDKYVARRDQVTDVLRETTFETARGKVNYQAVADKIGDIASTPAGGRAESQKALDWIVKRLDAYADQGRNDPRNAYELHKDIGALVAGKVADSNGAPMRLAGGLANDVKKELATQIERVAPGFKRYLETYSRLSKPIERLEAITERLGGAELGKVTTSLPSVANGGAQFTLSQHQMRGAVRDLERDTRLAPRQRDILNRVLGDLNADTFASRGGKQPGSDTYQNMASANFVRRMLGDTLAESGVGKMVQGPLNLLHKPLESRVSDIVTNAFFEPKLMEELLKKSRTSRGNPTLAGLLDYTAPRAAGGLLGSLLQ